MRLILENTDQIVEVNGIPCRVWEGKTEAGIPVTALITRVAVEKSSDCTSFERELQETPAPRQPSLDAWPLRFVL